MNKLILIVASGLAVGLFSELAVAQPSRRLLDAIQRVESGGMAEPCKAVGDRGQAKGAYQLHRAYVTDAKKFDSSLSGYTYDEICSDLSLSRRAVSAYLTYYAGRTASDEAYSKCHNSGPGFRKKTGKARENINRYWGRIKKVLRSK